jgi:type II secretory pathway component PulF
VILPWLAPIIIGIAAMALFIALGTAGVRRVLRWRLPAFKEASLAQVASAMAMMLKSGTTLNDALALMQQLEKGTPAEAEFARWRQRLAAGQGKFSEIAGDGKIFPPLFIWTVSQSSEDLGAGFQRASEMYQARAAYRTDVLLYSALPCSVLVLGLVILTQMQPALMAFTNMMNTLGTN